MAISRQWRWYGAIPVLALIALILGPCGNIAKTEAAGIGFDSGAAINQQAPYENTQTIKNIFEDQAIYGKFSEELSVKIYNFTPSQDGEQTITLWTMPRARNGTAQVTQPYLILLDPTDYTTGSSVGIPLPTDQYHTTPLKEAEANQIYNEPYLFQEYKVASSDTVKLKKDAKYYLVIFDTSKESANYVIKVGNGRVWSLKALAIHLPSWWRIKTDNFSGSSPFHFTSSTLSLLLFILSLAALLGILLVHETLSLQANRSRSAGYLLVKIQSLSRIVIWLSLWFLALGGYSYFNKQQWIGLPFILALLFVPILINMLLLTLKLSPKIANLDTQNKEAIVPFTLRKWLFLSSLVSVLSIGAFLVFTVIYFV